MLIVDYELWEEMVFQKQSGRSVKLSEQKIKTMDSDDYQEVVDRFIECSSHAYGEMPASVFFELLFEKMSERVTETIEVEGEIVDNQLVLRMPVDVETTVIH